MGESCELKQPTGPGSPANLSQAVKQELKYTIMVRRHTQNKEEINIEDRSDTNEGPVDVDVEMQNERRKRNNDAARKYRRNLRKRQEQVIKHHKEQVRSNKQLRKAVEQLFREKESLRRVLKCHIDECQHVILKETSENLLCRLDDSRLKLEELMLPSATYCEDYSSRPDVKYERSHSTPNVPLAIHGSPLKHASPQASPMSPCKPTFGLTEPMLNPNSRISMYHHTTSPSTAHFPTVPCLPVLTDMSSPHQTVPELYPGNQAQALSQTWTPSSPTVPCDIEGQQSLVAPRTSDSASVSYSEALSFTLDNFDTQVPFLHEKDVYWPTRDGDSTNYICL